MHEVAVLSINGAVILPAQTTDDFKFIGEVISEYEKQHPGTGILIKRLNGDVRLERVST